MRQSARVFNHLHDLPITYSIALDKSQVYCPGNVKRDKPSPDPTNAQPLYVCASVTVTLSRRICVCVHLCVCVSAYRMCICVCVYVCVEMHMCVRVNKCEDAFLVALIQTQPH